MKPASCLGCTHADILVQGVLKKCAIYICSHSKLKQLLKYVTLRM